MNKVSDSTVYVSLLRGINVGGHNKLRMKELEEAYRKLGFTAVRSYIQSGNLVFAAPKDQMPVDIETRLEEQISSQFGLSVPVMVLTGEAFEKMIARLPFSPDKAEKSVLVFLSGDGSQEWAERAGENVSEDERFEIARGVAYLHCPNGLAGSKAANALLSQPRIGVKATMRNWRTANRLLGLLVEARSEAG